MPKKQTTFSPELLINLRRGSGQALSAQLSGLLRDAIRSGRLNEGDCLPATRLLARDLAVSRSVVVNAYEQLIAEGYLTSAPRSGTRVAAQVAHTSPDGGSLHEQDSRLRYDFRPGVPDTTLFPRSAWGAALRSILQTLPADQLGYSDAGGTEEARSELAAYLRRVRGATVQPDHLLITTGFAQGLSLLSRVLHARGITRIAVEDPSHPGQHTLIQQAGVETIPITVDAEGIQVHALWRSGAKAVLVTPAHQFPLGVVLSPRRRQELLHWARINEGLIIEDDYDAEYRYDRAPIGALQGLAPEHVLYAGSVSKTLAPALRIGWLVVPDHLLTDLNVAKRYADLGSPVLDQLTYARMLATGQVDRHLRRVRQIYRARRDTLVTAVQAYLPGSAIQGIAAGLHAVVTLPDFYPEAELVQQACLLGIGIYGLQSYCLHKTTSPALVMGYAALPEPAITTAIRQLGQLYQPLPDKATIRQGSRVGEQ